MEHSWGPRKGPGQKTGVYHPTLYIGFGHEAQQGKDTVVNHLVREYGRLGGSKVPSYDGPWDIRRYSFADPLKVELFDFLQAQAALRDSGRVTPHPLSDNITRVVFPAPLHVENGEYSWGEKLAWVDRNKEALRPLLQWWGTELRRKQRQDYWVAQAVKKVEADRPQVALFSDMRFLNETKIMDVTVRVRRAGFLDSVAGKTHSSEAELDGYEYNHVLISPDGAVDDLKRTAEILFEHILREKVLLPHRG